MVKNEGYHTPDGTLARIDFAFDVVNAFTDAESGSHSRNGVDVFVLDPAKKVMKSNRRDERAFV